MRIVAKFVYFESFDALQLSIVNLNMCLFCNIYLCIVHKATFYVWIIVTIYIEESIFE